MLKYLAIDQSTNAQRLFVDKDQ